MNTTRAISIAMMIAGVVCIACVIGMAIAPVIYVLSTGDFPGSRLFFGLPEDSPVVLFLLNVSEALR